MIRLKNVFLGSLFFLLPGSVIMGQQTKSSFSKPELLKTKDGKVVEIETGSTAPFVRDMDGDGRGDLLVGEFGIVTCPGQEKVKGKRYVQGRCRLFKDVSREGKPELLPYEWLESGGEPLFVPITCCMPMSPAFADLNGDGREDLVSGSYPGELYWWPALPDGSWGERQVLIDEGGKAINLGKAITVFAADMNGNGVKDLIVNGLYDGIFWIENIAGKSEKARFRVHANRVKTTAGTELEGTYAITEDWDGDGKDDLLFGDRNGGIRWCRNTGSGYGEPELLIAPSGYSPVVLVGDTLQGPGEYSRFCVYDWDGDGKRDLVVTTETRMQQQRHLSPEELAKKAELQKEYDRVSATWGKLRDKAIKVAGVESFYINRVPYDKLPKQLAEKLKPVDEECVRLMGELDPYRERYFRNTGYVWVYYGQ